MILQNPYARQTRTHRIQADIPEDIFNFLRDVFPYHGSMQSLMSILIEDCVVSLKTNNITSQPIDEHTRTIVTSILRRSTIVSTSQASPARDGSNQSRKANRISPVGKDQQPCVDRENKKGNRTEKPKSKQKAKS